jgi:endonuclease/exonuclease/phosphatase family metal-dependent hydrolase
MRASFRLIAIALLILSWQSQQNAARSETGPVIGVLTQNQAFGADLTPLVAAPPDEVDAALLDVLAAITATDVPARMRKQAQGIARQRPDLVGLQEVLALGCIDPAPAPGVGCDDPAFAGAFVDFLDLTLKALDAFGVHYEAVATVDDLDTRGVTITLDDGGTVELPGLPLTINGHQVYTTALDRDVILARKDLVQQVAPVEFPDALCRRSADGCNYAAVLPVQLAVPGGALDLNFERGFVAVDAKVRGQRYRFVDTHLEVPDFASGFFQAAQAAQLIAVLRATTPAARSLIVVGDINSSPEDEPVPGPLPLPPPFDQGLVPPYLQLVEAGFTDAWTLHPGRDPGFTCCQDADLRNRVSLLSERIDMVFSQQTPDQAWAKVFGDKPADKTPSGLWPSDHAGLTAKLRLAPAEALLAAGG